MNVTCHIDTTNLSLAQAVFNRFGKTVPAIATNRTMLFVVRAAQKATPATEISRIDSELHVQVTPAIGKRGQPLSLKSARNRRYHTDRTPVGQGDFSAVPLTWLIISARAKLGSRYNLATSARWQIGGGIHPLKGRKVAEFAGIMQAIESRMVKARHSSTHFLQSSWTNIIERLIPDVPASYRGGLGRPDHNNRATLLTGVVVPARPGSNLAMCRIENTLGMSGVGAALDAKRNAAAHRILAPILQTAADNEFQAKMTEAIRRGWLDTSPELRALGFRVS